MAARGIQTLDLHKTVTDVCAPQPPHLYVNCSICRMEPCSCESTQPFKVPCVVSSRSSLTLASLTVHYKPAGYDMIAKPIAHAFRQ